MRQLAHSMELAGRETIGNKLWGKHCLRHSAKAEGSWVQDIRASRQQTHDEAVKMTANKKGVTYNIVTAVVATRQQGKMTTRQYDKRCWNPAQACLLDVLQLQVLPDFDNDVVFTVLHSMLAIRRRSNTLPSAARRRSDRTIALAVSLDLLCQPPF